MKRSGGSRLSCTLIHVDVRLWLPVAWTRSFGFVFCENVFCHISHLCTANNDTVDFCEILSEEDAAIPRMPMFSQSKIPWHEKYWNYFSCRWVSQALPPQYYFCVVFQLFIPQPSSIVIMVFPRSWWTVVTQNENKHSTFRQSINIRCSPTPAGSSSTEIGTRLLVDFSNVQKSEYREMLVKSIYSPYRHIHGGVSHQGNKLFGLLCCVQVPTDRQTS